VGLEHRCPVPLAFAPGQARELVRDGLPLPVQLPSGVSGQLLGGCLDGRLQPGPGAGRRAFGAGVAGHGQVGLAPVGLGLDGHFQQGTHGLGAGQLVGGRLQLLPALVQRAGGQHDQGDRGQGRDQQQLGGQAQVPEHLLHRREKRCGRGHGGSSTRVWTATRTHPAMEAFRDTRANCWPGGNRYGSPNFL
jgi:hypothetical protein